VELFEQVRRDRGGGGRSTHALARRYGVYPRTVRQALESPIPQVGQAARRVAGPKLGEFRELIDWWLILDLEAPQAAAYGQADLSAAD
jgi:hypothetical protein